MRPTRNLDADETESRLSRRDDIIAAAIRVFAERGYRRTTMRDIAEAAGLSKAGVYHHVRTKEELLVDIYDRNVSELLEVEMKIAAATLSPEEKLRVLLRTRILRMCASQLVHKILGAEESELPAELMRHARQARSDRVKLLASVIEDGVRVGQFAVPVSTNIAVLSLLGSVNFVHRWYDPKGPLPPEELADALTEHLLAGLRVERATPKREGTRQRRS